MPASLSRWHKLAGLLVGEVVIEVAYVWFLLVEIPQK